MLRAALLTTAVAGLLVAAPAPAAFDATVTVDEARPLTCHERLVSGPGAAQRSFTQSGTGLVYATLEADAGDWDLAVFDRRTGREVAGSAHFGAKELAQGFVADGQRLVVQACRRSGSASSARLNVRSIPVPLPAKQERIRLVEVKLPTEASADLLDTLGLDLTEHAEPGVRQAILHSDAEEAALRRAGLAFDVVVPDLVAADRKALSTPRADLPREVRDHTVPSGRVDYRDLEDYSADLKKLAEDPENADLVRPITLKHPSLEGRPIEGVEITRNVNDLGDGKPVFLQLGLHHAREWPSGEMPMEWAIDLVERASEGHEDAAFLDDVRVIVVPVVNPDGFVLSRGSLINETFAGDIVSPVALEGIAGFAYKRKNCRVADFAMPTPGECALPESRRLGTDLNRNYGSFWGGVGAALDLSSDSYRGGEAFSEPESRSVRDLIANRQVVTLITNHTSGGLVLRPPFRELVLDDPENAANDVDDTDRAKYKALGDELAARNGYVPQRAWELYDTTGGTEEWSYYTTGGLGFTFEIGDYKENGLAVGFHPPYATGVIAEYRGPTMSDIGGGESVVFAGDVQGAGGNRAAYYFAANSAKDDALHAKITGDGAPGATLRVRKTLQSYATTGTPPTFQDVLDSTMTVPADGRFTWHVNPSTRPLSKRSHHVEQVSRIRRDRFTRQAATVHGEYEEIPISIAPSEAGSLLHINLVPANTDNYELSLWRGDQLVARTPEYTAQQGGPAVPGVPSEHVYTGRSESLEHPDAEAGEYTLRVENFAAANDYRGIIELYESAGAIDTPVTEETWELTCESAGGQVLGQRSVHVERGATADVGDLC